MKFEHLVAVNDPMNPLADTLTREQLWRGLVLRAEQPTAFIPHLDKCEILEREAGSLKRRQLLRCHGRVCRERSAGCRTACQGRIICRHDGAFQGYGGSARPA